MYVYIYIYIYTYTYIHYVLLIFLHMYLLIFISSFIFNYDLDMQIVFFIYIHIYGGPVPAAPHCAAEMRRHWPRDASRVVPSLRAASWDTQSCRGGSVIAGSSKRSARHLYVNQNLLAR